MEIGKIYDAGVLHKNAGEDLLEMVKKYPDYPIAVLAGNEANIGEHYWMYCSSVGIEVEEILDCESDWVKGEIILTDRDIFEDNVADRVYDILTDELGRNPTDEEQDEKIKEVLEAHEPFWKKCITIKVDN